MNRLIFASLSSLIFIYGTVNAECINCMNAVTGAIPNHTGQLEEVSTFLPCKLQGAKPSADDPFAVATDPVDTNSDVECGCIIGKNVEKIKEQYPKQQEKHKKAFGKMMEARFVAGAIRLSHLGHGLELSGVNIGHLAGKGGICDLGSQLDGLSCSGTDQFQKNVMTYFPLDLSESQNSEINYKKCNKFEKDKSSAYGPYLACIWKVRGSHSAIGLLPDQRPSSKQCLDNLAMKVISSASSKSSEALKIIGEFINRDGLINDFKLNYKLFDNLIREGLTPKAALERLQFEDKQYSQLYTRFKGYPLILAMLENPRSFEELKGIFSGDTAQLNNPERFLEKQFGGADNNHVKTVIANIEKSCKNYKKDLEMLLCDKSNAPFMLDDAYRKIFFESVKEEGVDTLEEAFLCHAQHCKNGKVYGGLEGYCLIDEKDKEQERPYQSALIDFGANIESLDDILNKAALTDVSLQNTICPFLTCTDEQRKQQEMCHRDNPGDFNDVELLLNQCPDGKADPNATSDDPCFKENFEGLKAYVKYQKQLIASGVVTVREVIDTDAEPNAAGEYPTKKIYSRKEGFADSIWDLDRPEPQEVTTTLTSDSVTSKTTGDSEAVKPSFEGGQPVESANVQIPSAQGMAVPVTSSQQLDHAKRLANAAINMAENATRLSDRASAQMIENNESVQDGAKKLASFASNPTRASSESTGSDDSIQNRKPRSRDTDTVEATTYKKPVMPSGPFKGSSAPGQGLSDSVIDIDSNSIASIGAPGNAAAGVSSEASSRVAGGAISSAASSAKRGRKIGSAQILTIDKSELSELADERLEERGVDPDDPFVIEVIVDGKVVKVEVKPFIYKGKTLYRPELEIIKKTNPELYNAIRKSPIFKEYLKFEKNQKIYRWSDVLKILSS